MEKLTVSDVIDLAGGARKIAAVEDIDASSVRHWRRLGYVPPARIFVVADLAGVDPRQIPSKPKTSVSDCPTIAAE